MKPKFQVNNLVRVAVLERTFSKSATTDWSHKLYKVTEKINHKMPSYKIDNLKKRNNEALLKKTELAITENNSVMKTLIIT